MTAVLPIAAASVGETKRAGWRTHLIALAAVGATILLLFHRDAFEIAAIWWNISTFNHCLLIPPIIAWLVHQRLPELRRLQPGAWAPGLLLVAAGAAAWLLGEAGGLALARHSGLVLMLQGSVVACLGKSVSRGLTFPLCYGLFLIPAGAEIIPLMQTVTAEMCMTLLALVGVPAHIDGVFISIPSGYFEVAEACAGVEFLIAMIAYGALVANTCFRSPHRRAIFMAAAVALPIVANGVRAWGTIYISHLTSTDFAASFDHVVYGWFFFAFIVAVLMAASWRWFDRGLNDPWFDPRMLQPEGTSSGTRPRLIQVAAAVVALAILPVLWSAAVASTGARPVPAEIDLPQLSGWQRVPARSVRSWRPHFAGADAIRTARYRNAAGQQVDLAIAVFRRQQEGKEIVAYGQGAVGPDSDWSWTASGPTPPDGKLDRIVSFGTVREVATFYRVGSILTGSGLEVKLETMKTRLIGGPQRAVAILVSAEAPADGVSPRPAIDAFLQDLGPLDRLADRAAGLE